MSDNSIKLGMEFGSLKTTLEVPVSEVMRWLKTSRIDKTASVVAQRFIQIFEDHGIQPTQISHFIPQISLDALSSQEKLLSALTPPVLEQASKLFAVNRDWLDGISEVIYPLRYCYKNCRLFFDDIRNLVGEDLWYSVRALCSEKTVDSHLGREQCLVLVLVAKLKTEMECDLYRYYIYGDEWDWGYAPCRIQLKAMARLVFKTLEDSIPLHVVSETVLKKVRDGRLIPNMIKDECVATNPALEDYALSLSESANARETEELPLVLKYIEDHKLTAKQ